MHHRFCFESILKNFTPIAHMKNIEKTILTLKTLLLDGLETSSQNLQV